MGATVPSEAENALKERFFRRSSGLFVQVGANDPLLLSQTHDLECLGWSGVLLEPQPDLVREALRIPRASASRLPFVACRPTVRQET